MAGEGIGYWTQHSVNTGGGRNDDPDPRWIATCETCGWTGTKNPRSRDGWQATANEVQEHRAESREWVPVAPLTEPGVVYVSEDQNYDFSGLRDVYASLYAALKANPHPWLAHRDGYWVREDGDAIQQTAMSITRTEVLSEDATDELHSADEPA